jgi:hypothetical protein
LGVAIVLARSGAYDAVANAGRGVGGLVVREGVWRDALDVDVQIDAVAEWT